MEVKNFLSKYGKVLPDIVSVFSASDTFFNSIIFPSNEFAQDSNKILLKTSVVMMNILDNFLSKITIFLLFSTSAIFFGVCNFAIVKFFPYFKTSAVLSTSFHFFTFLIFILGVTILDVGKNSFSLAFYKGYNLLKKSENIKLETNRRNEVEKFILKYLITRTFHAFFLILKILFLPISFCIGIMLSRIILSIFKFDISAFKIISSIFIPIIFSSIFLFIFSLPLDVLFLIASSFVLSVFFFFIFGIFLVSSFSKVLTNNE